MGKTPVAVVDLFAGPGGLGEGFASLCEADGSAPFRLHVSVEKDPAAHRTLRFRSFTRSMHAEGVTFDELRFDPGSASAEQDVLDQLGDSYRAHWASAEHEAVRAELGGEGASTELAWDRLATVPEDSILIGGPPCQAYSLVGRARNSGIPGYTAEADGRHFLYREYVRILARTQPAIFVMENVKGILSSRVSGNQVFTNITRDLVNAGYVLVPLAPEARKGDQHRLVVDSDGVRPSDFVVRSERFGVPQARHRVIVLGVRKDIAAAAGEGGCSLRDLARLTPVSDGEPATVAAAIGDLAPLRSRLSRATDRVRGFDVVVADQVARVRAALSSNGSGSGPTSDEVLSVLDTSGRDLASPTLRPWTVKGADLGADLQAWLRKSSRPHNHAPRGHMADDLGRYLFAACYAQATGRSPKAKDFPPELAPSHANWLSGKFSDRFRVQVANAPSTTITSHIAKDGHYFIHPDPAQCRSLSVREAARLQSFPDDYVFLGNKTQQYVQVGNAVPPYLAVQIAAAVFRILSASRS